MKTFRATFFWNIPLGLLLAFLTSCNQLPLVKNEACQDLFEHGRRQGALGLSLEEAENIKSCSTTSASGQAAYSTGYNLGITQYCDPRNAYNLGKTGQAAHNICPRISRDAFSPAYRSGIEARLVTKKNSELSLQIDELKDVLEQVGQSQSRRKSLLNQILQLQGRRAKNEDRLSEYEQLH